MSRPVRYGIAYLYLAAIFGAGFVLIFFVETTTNLSAILQPPSLQHIFGTDSLGRDLFHRSLEGAFLSGVLALSAAIFSGVMGLAIGAAIGWKGGRADLVLMRLIEVLESIPDLLLAVVLALSFQFLIGAETPASYFFCLVLVLGLTGWFEVARQARGLILRERQLLYADAARAMGASRYRILLRHIWPNIQTSVWILILLQIPGFIIFEASLSFFGFGLKPPHPSLGQIFLEGWKVLSVSSHVILGPTLILFFSLICFKQLLPQPQFKNRNWIRKN